LFCKTIRTAKKTFPSRPWRLIIKEGGHPLLTFSCLATSVIPFPELKAEIQCEEKTLFGIVSHDGNAQRGDIQAAAQLKGLGPFVLVAELEFKSAA